MDKRTRDGVGYELHGHGDPLVVALHDWMGSRHNWVEARAYLGSEMRWAFLDLRGYGRSVERRDARTFARAAEDVLAVADQEGADTVHVVGHSMTGLVLQRLALDSPQRLGRAAAVSPFPAGVSMDEQSVAFFTAAASDPAVAAQLFGQVTGGLLGEGWANRKVERMQRDTDRENLLHYLGQISAEAHFADELAAARPSVPLLVLAGERDLPPFAAAAYENTLLRWFPDARLETLPTGHFAMQEAPARTAALLREFLGAGT